MKQFYNDHRVGILAIAVLVAEYVLDMFPAFKAICG